MRLERHNVFSLRTFLALRERELNASAFRQSFETRTLDSGEVDEYVRAAFLLDETKTFRIVEPLHSTGNSRHSL